jgi:hypothetical protein
MGIAKGNPSLSGLIGFKAIFKVFNPFELGDGISGRIGSV